MDNRLPKALLVDDEANILKTMRICLEEAGLQVTAFQDSARALDAIHQQSFDLAFLDLKMMPVNGMQLLEKIKDVSPHTTVAMVTAHGSIENAVQAVKAGAYDYIQKPFDYVELQLIANRMQEYHNLKKEIRRLRAGEMEVDFITQNPPMREMLNLARRVAPSDLPVLIEGESGTGKELVADLVQQESTRADQPYLKVNCAALPETLLESELFGHVKGAFTGAGRDRQGRFEEAHGGTLFLDEIAEIPPGVQAKLLRALQNYEITRLGENRPIRIDVRIIAATNQNLEAALEEGTFREDLFYRLNAIRLKLLPLRERPEDLLPLITHFFNQVDKSNTNLTSQALQLLRKHRWNGNVRELDNVIRRAALLAGNGDIAPRHLPEEIQSGRFSHNQLLSLEEVEKSHIARVLDMAKDLQEASRLLGIDPATLWRKRKRYGL